MCGGRSTPRFGHTDRWVIIPLCQQQSWFRLPKSSRLDYHNDWYIFWVRPFWVSLNLVQYLFIEYINLRTSFIVSIIALSRSL